MPTSIQLRRGTTTQWTTVNPVLKDGEIGWDSTANKFKVGNGVSSWTALAYQGDAGLNSKISAFADPNADRLVFWDDSAGTFAPLTASTGLAISGTNLTVNAASETVSGRVELATAAETTTGTDTTRAIHPAGLKAQKGVANGLAGLDANGKVPTSHLPASQVGTSLMGTYSQRPPASSTAAGTIYYSTDNMESYRCNGSAWTVIAAGSELGSAELRTTFKSGVNNGGSWVDVPGMAVTFVAGERPFRTEMTVDMCVSVAKTNAQARVVINGVVVMTEISAMHAEAYKWDTRTANVRWYGLVPGNIHTIKMQIKGDTGGEAWIDGNNSTKTSLLTVTGV